MAAADIDDDEHDDHLRALPREALAKPRRSADRIPLVLVVDDDFFVCSAVAEALRNERFLVATAANGVRALEMLKSGLRPALVLLDLNMPGGMDGAQVIEAMQNDSALASVPVVILSAFGDHVDESLAKRVASVLHKPLNLGTLVNVVERHRTRIITATTSR
jgi:CheY-like chemotaxis protein